MVVILCHAADAAAVWLHEKCREQGVTCIELVSVEQLVFSRRIVHRQSTDAESGEVHIADGRIVRPEAISGLVNRVEYLPTQHFGLADAVDRAYASAELSAFVLAWLNGVRGRVINPATPSAPGGGWLPATTVRHLAAMAGLPTLPWSCSSNAGSDQDASTPSATHAIVIFDGRLFGPIVPRELQDGARRLATLLGLPLLQVSFYKAADRWLFVAASGAADFRIGGEPLAASLAAALQSVEPA
jgi:hypothetical protein